MGKQWKQWLTLFLGAPKSLQMVIAAMKLKDAYSLEGKLWPTYSILKSRDITLLTKVHIIKAIVFLVVMYGCESWTMKKSECWKRIDAFELWYWRRLSRVPWTAGRSNQSSLKEINSEYSLEGLMLKLKLQYVGHLAGGQREEFRPWQRSWGRRLGIRKGVIKPQETPCSRASNPKTRVCLMLSPTLLTLRGALPHNCFSRKRSKRAAPRQ